MATRQQTGGTGPSRPARPGGTVRPVYEDFTPSWEWKQQEQAQLLLVYLPGFVKEQIKVSVEGINSLRVRGERFLGGNKYSRFQEDFRIPEDCNASGVRAKFERGALTVTIPKKTRPIDQVGAAKQEAKTPSREATSLPGNQVPPRTIPTATEAKKTNGKGRTEGPSSQKVATEPPKTQKGQDETPLKPSPSTALAKQPVDGKRNFELEKAVQKEKDIEEKGKESLEGEYAIEKVVKKEKEERGGATAVRQAEITGLEKEERGGTATVRKARISDFSDVLKQKQTTDDATSGGGGSYDGLTDKYKQEMKELIAKQRHPNEEKQLLLNMGTAILVIVALGAYISYTMSSSSRNAEH